jgi:hypothetical protein
LLVEEDEQQGDLGSFVRQPIGVSLCVAGEQPMRLLACAGRIGVD